MNTYSLCHNAPISEFIEMLRDWLIAGNADPRAINKVDELREHDPVKHEAELDAVCAERDDMAGERDDMAGERDDIAEELLALYTYLDQHPELCPDEVLTAARLCIQRHKIT